MRIDILHECPKEETETKLCIMEVKKGDNKS